MNARWKHPLRGRSSLTLTPTLNPVGFEFGGPPRDVPWINDAEEPPRKPGRWDFDEIRIVGDSDDLPEVDSEVPATTAPPDRGERSEIPGPGEGERGIREASGFLAELSRLARTSGVITQQVLTTALCAGAAAPAIAAAFSDWGTDAPLRLWRVGAYAASHIAGGIVGGNQQKTNLTNEDTVRKALSDLLLSADKTVQRTGSATEARHHLAALLADPVIIGGILTVAATNGRELLTLCPRQTDGLAGASEDDWLLDEVIEALEELALLPNSLAAALTVVYSQLLGR